MTNKNVFEPWTRFPGRYKDPYDAINQMFFDDVIRNRKWSALPAGWLNPRLDYATQWIPPTIFAEKTVPFLLDQGSALGDSKKSVASLLSYAEGTVIHPDEFTLCTSNTQANLVILFTLKKAGFKKVLIDCPAYYGTIAQAISLDFEVKLVDQTTAQSVADEQEILNLPPSQFENCAVWITQPRFAVGTDWGEHRFRRLVQLLPSSAILIIDEASDQSACPTKFHEIINSVEPSLRVIRARGIFKGIGLNGLRLSAILHSEVDREDIADSLDICGGSLDRLSLQAAEDLSSDPKRYVNLLRSASHQVISRRRLAQTVALGSSVIVSPLENGYIGTLFFPLHGDEPWLNKMERFLSKCRNAFCPVVIGDSMYFFPDYSYAAVRINYFTETENVRKSVEIIRGLL